MLVGDIAIQRVMERRVRLRSIPRAEKLTLWFAHGARFDERLVGLHPNNGCRAASKEPQGRILFSFFGYPGEHS